MYRHDRILYIIISSTYNDIWYFYTLIYIYVVYYDVSTIFICGNKISEILFMMSMNSKFILILVGTLLQ